MRLLLGRRRDECLEIAGKGKHVDRAAERPRIDHLQHNCADQGIEGESKPTARTACESQKFAPDQAEESCAFIKQPMATSVNPAVRINRASTYFRRYIRQQPADALRQSDP